MICYTVLMMILYTKLISSTDIEDSSEQQEKIAKGIPAEPGKYPYYVSIQWEVPFTGYMLGCGGALIARQFVLTAAHCLKSVDLVTGARILPNYRNTPFIHNNDLTFKIKSYMVHPGFNFTGPVNIKQDIAVILLDQPDPRPNATIRLPITLNPLGQPVTLIGFGAMETGQFPDILYSANLFTLTDQVCLASNQPGAYHPGFNLCTSNANGSVSCSGDSGGPLIWTENDISYIQGVVSASYPPCGSQHITNYASVFAHLDFIHQSISYLTLINHIPINSQMV
ncbi:chymotrypsin-2-like [Tetranychus urticae]|uniref:chymotrypsin-2-like n=1 Tax=Tetranychus urticae TaxID=32264 RepID=UPI00077BC46D|nr:chymotrypsin-2-like [Tetranychus urticae]